MSRSAANEEREVQTALRAAHRGISTREIATLLYGHEAVSAQSDADSSMRAQTRRRVRRALALNRDEHPDLVAGR